MGHTMAFRDRRLQSSGCIMMYPQSGWPSTHFKGMHGNGGLNSRDRALTWLIWYGDDQPKSKSSKQSLNTLPSSGNPGTYIIQICRSVDRHKNNSKLTLQKQNCPVLKTACDRQPTGAAKSPDMSWSPTMCGRHLAQWWVSRGISKTAKLGWHCSGGPWGILKLWMETVGKANHHFSQYMMHVSFLIIAGMLPKVSTYPEGCYGFVIYPQVIDNGLLENPS